MMKVGINSRRSQFKARPTSSWKKNLKDQCFRRIKEQRLNLFTKLRQVQTQNNQNGHCFKNNTNASSFSFSGEFVIGKNDGNNNHMGNSNGFSTSNIFKNNGNSHCTKNNHSLALAPCSAVSSDLNSILQSEVKRMKANFVSSAEITDLSPEEYENIVREMEKELMIEIKENEQELAAAFEKDLSRAQEAFDADIDDYYNMMTSKEKSGGRLLCPVCNSNYIHISNDFNRKAIIQCSCGINFKIRADIAKISEMKEVINQAIDVHRRNCMFKPTFKYCHDESTAMVDEDDHSMADDNINGIFLVCTHCQHFKSVFSSQ